MKAEFVPIVKTTIKDYYIEQKVIAFSKSYEPCEYENQAEDVFTDAKLRKYFQAYYVQGMGDLLILYIDHLDERGFHLRTSITGQPAIFVRHRHESTSLGLLPIITECEEKNEEARPNRNFG